jgi:hypothetical protein
VAKAAGLIPVNREILVEQLKFPECLDIGLSISLKGHRIIGRNWQPLPLGQCFVENLINFTIHPVDFRVQI